jgi:hypothetical protein
MIFLGIFFLFIVITKTVVEFSSIYDFNRRKFNSYEEKNFWRKKIFGKKNFTGQYIYFYKKILKL